MVDVLNPNIVEVTKAQQTIILNMTEKLELYERLLSGQSQFIAQTPTKEIQ